MQCHKENFSKNYRINDGFCHIDGEEVLKKSICFLTWEKGGISRNWGGAQAYASPDCVVAICKV
jgi:hypothetical protein